MSIANIYEGWKNNLFPKEELKELIAAVGEERMRICEQCEFHSKFHSSIRPDAHCTQCGCTLSAKTKCLSCKCPTDKWMEVLSPKEEDEIKENE